MIRYMRWICLLSAFSNSLLHSQTGGNSPGDEKMKDAYVKIVNACDTSQPERWRTGLDLKFKDQAIGRDIRLGERGPIGKISFVGRDLIDVYRHGDSRVLASVPARLQAGGIYTLVVMGSLEANSADLKVEVIEEFPLPPESERPGQCRVVFLNAVKSYPVSISVGKETPLTLAFGEKRELFLNPGEQDLGLWFRDSKGAPQRLQAGMVAETGANYTAVLHPSEERSDRPSLFRFNAVEDRTRANEMAVAPSTKPAS